MKTRSLFVFLLVLTAFGAALTVAAQDPRDLMPDVSSAKAKAILNDAVAALGGPGIL